MVHPRIIAIKTATTTIASPNVIGIQSGLVTHHHDQVATCPMPANFSTKKIKNNTVPNPIPLLVTTCFSISYYLISASGNADIVDIDMNIAGGFYTEAEEKLRQVIENAPRNFTAKLRLAEVYYITEQADAFSDLAEELMVKHRKEITDDDWQRLVRMGKMIAPDFPLFSGPKSVGLRA